MGMGLASCCNYFRNRMVKVITQETIDEVVKENVEEFGMEMVEAMSYAREQFCIDYDKLSE